MEFSITIVILFLFFVLPVLPQIVGFCSYLLLKKVDDLVSHLAGVMIPPLSFFYLSRWFMPSAGLGFSSKGMILLTTGTFIQLFFALLLQLALHNRHKPDGAKPL